MKSTVFELKFPSVPLGWKAETGVKFPIPTLKAYAIEYAEFTCKGGLNEHKEMIQGEDFELVEDGLFWHHPFTPMFTRSDYYRLVIHYHGIKDYSLLFPHVGNKELQERLGHFYEEAELSLDSGAWLAFSLMCGAVYEGLLFHYFGQRETKFEKLIDAAHAEGVINDATAKIMHSTRQLRNLVHASRSDTEYVRRAQAMEMRTVLDRLIKDTVFWEGRSNPAQTTVS